MKYSDNFPSPWLAASDVDGAQDFKIESCKKEGVGHPPEQKPVVRFVNEDKGLVLNKTNFKSIATLHGDETDDWYGKLVELFVSSVEYQGETRPCIRVRGPSGGLENDTVLAGKEF